MQRLIAALVAGAAYCLPSATAADVTVRQDSCRTSGNYPVAYFSIVNASPAPACRMTLFPHDASCFLLQCGAPSGWSCFLGDVTTFYIADAIPGTCIAAGETRGGFSAELLAAFCCQGAAFFAADGTHLGSQDVCFDCDTVGVERDTWGRVKTRFE